MSRPRVIAGNWKMYKTIPEAVEFIEKLTPHLNLSQAAELEVLLAVPYTAIHPAAQAAAGSPLKIGAQNMHDSSEGAFTGEIAAKMVRDAGASFVVLGHSERRHLFFETDSFINKKVLKALDEGLDAILCVGETLQERREGATEKVLALQLKDCLEGVSSKLAVAHLKIAYEPVWAIGTGQTATPDMAEETHKFIRSWVESHLGKRAFERVPLLYGGSVKPDNLVSLLNCPDIDGALIGGASLSPKSFADMVEIASKIEVS